VEITTLEETVLIHKGCNFTKYKLHIIYMLVLSLDFKVAVFGNG